MLSVLIVIGAKCSNDDELMKLRIKNNSSQTLYESCSTNYPDTSLNKILSPACNPQIHKIEANTFQKEHYNSPTEDIFDYNDTLIVFLFNAQILESNPWDSVVKNYMILKRYDLSLQDLQDMDWTITYP